MGCPWDVRGITWDDEIHLGHLGHLGHLARFRGLFGCDFGFEESILESILESKSWKASLKSN